MGFTVLGLLALLVAGGLWLQRETAVAAGAERDALRDQVRERAHARAEHQRLEAAQVPEAELAVLRADHAAVARLRDEIDALKKEAEKTAAAPPPPRAPSSVVPASEWRNVGRATPRAAIETALWAAAGGDIDALAAAVTFDPQNRPAVDEYFARLTPELQAQHRTPERLAAFFTAKDVPLGSMRIFGERENKPDDVSIGVMLEAPDGKAKPSLLNVRRADDGWRLVVPMAALQNYALTIGASGFIASPATPAPVR
jgi:hypothetical protein